MDSSHAKTSRIHRVALITLTFVALFHWLSPARCYALRPEEILLVANGNVREGVELARYYQQRRQIPEKNFLLLKTTGKENISRGEYERQIAAPLREFLDSHPDSPITCLALFYGLPLRILPPPIPEENEKKIKKLKAEKTALEKIGPEAKDKRAQGVLKTLRKEIARLSGADQEAALDSELALVRLGNYPLPGWQMNPLFLGQGKEAALPKERLLLTGRIDGPDEKVAKRIVDDSIRAEETGLRGTAYFDAQWKHPKNKEKLSGYAFYDKSLHETARLLSEKGFPVELDSKPELFAAGWRLPAALYCGWYSLAKYVDAFAWQPGSVGYHIASGECRTLKDRESTAWCKMMLEKGIAATLGPVSEPYVQAFPIPELFFSLLIRGDLTLAECFSLSSPYLSWKMVLIGDPLYRPFKNTGHPGP
ncbi:TIGR03790 family protein [Thiovibrio sp. JS02]